MGNIVGDPFALATISIGLVRNPRLEHEKDISNRPTASLVDRIHRIDHCRYPEPIPEVCLVDHRLHAVLYHWYHHRLRS